MLGALGIGRDLSAEEWQRRPPPRHIGPPRSERARPPTRPAAWALRPARVRSRWRTVETAAPQRSQLAVAGEVRLDQRHDLARALRITPAEERELADCELVSLAYRRWGEAFAARLSGSFAVAVWDPERGRLVCSTDHAGFRPLYYADREGRFAFSTSPDRALALAGLSPRTDLDYWLAVDLGDFGFLLDRSPYEGLRKLPPGRTMVIEAGGRRRWIRHWSPEPRPSSAWTDRSDCAEALREALERGGCRRRPGRAVARGPPQRWHRLGGRGGLRPAEAGRHRGPSARGVLVVAPSRAAAEGRRAGQGRAARRVPRGARQLRRAHCRRSSRRARWTRRSQWIVPQPRAPGARGGPRAGHPAYCCRAGEATRLRASTAAGTWPRCFAGEGELGLECSPRAGEPRRPEPPRALHRPRAAQGGVPPLVPDPIVDRLHLGESRLQRRWRRAYAESLRSRRAARLPRASQTPSGRPERGRACGETRSGCSRAATWRSASSTGRGPALRGRRRVPLPAARQARPRALSVVPGRRVACGRPDQGRVPGRDRTGPAPGLRRGVPEAGAGADGADDRGRAECAAPPAGRPARAADGISLGSPDAAPRGDRLRRASREAGLSRRRPTAQASR